MSKGYLPLSDDGLLSFSGDLVGDLNAHPDAYGLTPEQNAALSDAQAAYATALAAARNPLTRGRSTIFTKSLKKKFLISLIRQAVRIIQANPAVTNQQRYDLGITVRKPPTPVPPPSEAPRLDVSSVSGMTVTLRLHDQAGNRRRPDGVAGARLYSYTGPDAPPPQANWTWVANVTGTSASVTFEAPAVPGDRVWLTACWFNPTQSNGPLASPVATFLQYGVGTAAVTAAQPESPASPESTPKLKAA